MTGGHAHVAPDGSTTYAGPVEVIDLDPGELTPTGELITGTPPSVDRRHPVEVTGSRLQDHVEAYGRNLTPVEVDILADAVEVLDALRARLDRASRRSS
jgi:hypothetical protein